MIVAVAVLLVMWGYGVWYENFGPGAVRNARLAQAERERCRVEGVEYDGNWWRGGRR